MIGTASADGPAPLAAGTPARPLAAHIFAALHGRDLVLLDTQQGDYELLAGAGQAVLLSPDRRQIGCLDPALLRELESLKLFADTITPAARADPAFPTRSPLLEPPPAMAWSHTVQAAAGWADMLVNYHGRPFAHLTARPRRLSVAPQNRSDVSQDAAAFDQLSIWLPFQGDCLYRCFHLLRRLGARGASVDWVFGVRTWPFYAHCWLQQGDVVLTDVPDRLASFSTILVI